MTKKSAVLLLSCPDRKGIVAAISGFIAQHSGNILHADEHNDRDSNTFLMRVEFDPAALDLPLSEFTWQFGKVAEQFAMQWRLALSDVRLRMAILVSKYDHCLVDLLYRHKSGELACDIPCIISNHSESQRIAEFYQVPFFLVPIEKDSKHAAERQILTLIERYAVDFIVLARYMQILSTDFERGVKLIGATSHYVTEVLDDGPIIEQDVARVSHRDSVEDLIQKGRDLEKVVLSRAVRWHIENRVLLYGNKTVVFE
jgi:formyltetrahydrofolate deformylase